jgi:hypothetical protein
LTREARLMSFQNGEDAGGGFLTSGPVL